MDMFGKAWKSIQSTVGARPSGKQIITSNNENINSGNNHSVIEGSTTIHNASRGTVQYISHTNFISVPDTHRLVAELTGVSQPLEEASLATDLESSRSQSLEAPQLLNGPSAGKLTSILQKPSGHLRTRSNVSVTLTESSDSLGVGNSSRSRYSSRSLGSQSSSLRTKAITAPNLKYYIPTTTQRHIKNYMKTSPFSAEADTIPLWNPSPTQHDHIERWGKNVYIGDVGLFNEDGGFDTLFNIFETEDENISRGLNPPKGFVPYFKKLSETLKTNLIFSRAKKNLYIRGFNKDKRKESDDRPRIRIPDSLRSKPDRVYCSAMHLSQGFLRLKIGQFERAHISEYVEKYQETWRPHLEENALDETRARSFVIIVASFRAQSWALATATKPRLSSRKGKATLRTVSGIPDMSFWESDDDDILTNSGPSDLDIKEMQSYLQTISNKKDREEIEWCHCVAVQADFLEDEMEASRRGSSRNSSRTTIRP